MSYLFNRLGFEVPFDGAQYLDESKVKKVVTLPPVPQPGFTDWLLGASDTSLVATDGTMLTASDGALTWNSASVNIGAATGFNALKTPYADSQTYTQAIVFRLDSAAAYVICGSLTLSGGDGLQKNASGALCYTRRNGSSITATALTVNATAGNLIFVAFTRNGDNVTILVGGSSPVTLSQSKSAGSIVGIGNAGITTAGYSKALEVAEYLYRPTLSTADELSQIYADTKTRCQARGLSIV
ncbi:hypothetical protein NG99_26660 [Erwinia typographi]|uniref:Uncharacterized protein n=1 Tax=Erwinia typographi TaxID=371042 RepID=A0A0A3YLD6_9GAMM|nr:hypothetical protein [Erwinia typographi]KGT86146.1 hypothetical protein NG99_26660 [Erwinia typographi]